MINGYLAIGVVLACSALLHGWMFITAKAHHGLKVLLAAVALGLSLYGWVVFNSVLGLPTSNEPQQASVLLKAVIDKPHNAIYIWVLEQPQPRAYVFPYSEGLENALNDAQERAKRMGTMARVGPRQGKLGQNRGLFDDNPVFVDIVSPLPPKE